MRQFCHLLGDHLGDGRMRMPQRDGRDAGDEIDVSLTLVIEEVLEVPLSDEQGLLVVMEIKIGHESGTILSDLLIGKTGVGQGNVTALRQLQRGEARQGKVSQHVTDRGPKCKYYHTAWMNKRINKIIGV